MARLAYYSSASDCLRLSDTFAWQFSNLAAAKAVAEAISLETGFEYTAVLV